MMKVMETFILLAVFGCLISPCVMAQPVVRPSGELQARIQMVHDRFLKGADPAFTDDFILADVELRPEYPRRFAEFSGDLSGRYIEAMALIPPADWNGLEGIVKKALACQRADGRFGNPNLSFTGAEVGREHMALLWGNGRMLVGLMSYYSVKKDPAVLAAAQKLGDFLVAVRAACSAPDVMERLVKEAANGYICFTQTIEGLVMLAQASGEARYMTAAEEITAAIPKDRGVQHSHGYLTTLRGVVMLAQATGKTQYLEQAEKAFLEIVASPDYFIMGGLPEFFTNPNHRDEGCSEADFVRLALQLWQATHNRAYLGYAEHCLVNHLYGNQFSSGDFGHHAIEGRGIVPLLAEGRAWWCCTMHGLRAFKDVQDLIISREENTLRVNLFIPATWSSDGTSLSMGCSGNTFAITFDRAPATETALAVRQPDWAAPFTFTLNGKPVDAKDEGGYWTVRRVWNAGDQLGFTIACTTRIQLHDGSRINLDALKPDAVVEGALFYGLWLLSVDGVYDPAFLGEPWDGNVIFMPAALTADTPAPDERDPLAVLPAHFTLTYRHDGFPELGKVTLRPCSEQSRHHTSSCALWLKMSGAPAGK